MKIMQLNFWQGRLSHKIIDLLQDEQPDIVCAQEVFHCAEPTGRTFDQFSSLSKIAEQAGYPYVYFSSTFSLDIADDLVDFGNAILSKIPLNNTSVYDTFGEYHHIDAWGDHSYNTRAVQTAEVEIHGKTLTIVNHHGYHTSGAAGDEHSVESMKKVAELVKTIDGPYIFCGDLNVIPDSPAIQELPDSLINHTKEHKVPSTLSGLSRLRIDVPCDHILTTPDIQTSNFRVLDTPASDHMALTLEVEL